MENKAQAKQTVQKLQLQRRGYDLWWHTFSGISAKDGEEKHFFIACYVLNAQKGEEWPIFVETKYPSYVMIKAGVFGEEGKQLHRFFGIREFECAKEELRLVAGDFFLSETVLKGSVTVTEAQTEEHKEYGSDTGTMSWLLPLERETDGIRTRYSGNVYLDGERYSIQPKAPFGYAGRTWGKALRKPMLWLSSSCIRSRKNGVELFETFFDFIGDSKMKGLPSESNLIGKLCYEGEDFLFDFSKLLTFSQTKYRCKETENNVVWHVRLASTQGAVEIKAVCPKSEMTRLMLPAPDREEFETLWSGCTGRAELRLFRREAGELKMVDRLTAEQVNCFWGE